MGALIAEIQFVETGSHDLTEDEVADANAIISDGFNRQWLEDLEVGGKHAPRISWAMTKEDAEDLLTIVSLIHRRLDSAHMPPRV